MFCSGCGARFDGEGRFCPGCGAARPIAAADPVSRARQQAGLGELVGAAATLRTALECSPGDRSLRLALAAVHCQAGQWPAALGMLEGLRDGAAFDPVIEAYRAGVLLAIGRVGEAKDALDAAADRAPDDFLVALKRGEMFCRLGIYPTAEAELERALAIGPPDDDARRTALALLVFARERSKRGFVRRLIGGRVAGQPSPALGVA